MSFTSNSYYRKLLYEDGSVELNMCIVLRDSFNGLRDNHECSETIGGSLCPVIPELSRQTTLYRKPFAKI